MECALLFSPELCASTLARTGILVTTVLGEVMGTLLLLVVGLVLYYLFNRASRAKAFADFENQQSKRFCSTCVTVGNTIKVHPGTIEKISRPAVLSVRESLLKELGYGDSMSDFLKTTAGSKFLAVAAPLVTTMTLYASGAVLSSLLEDTQRDTTGVPSARGLQPLLEDIRKRYCRLRFSDEIIRWQNILRQTGPDWEKPDFCGGFCPNGESIKSLVEAIGRVDGRIPTATIAPWVIAFIEWFLGYPPSVFSEDCQVHESTAKVSVIITHCGRVDVRAVEISVTTTPRECG